MRNPITSLSHNSMVWNEARQIWEVSSYQEVLAVLQNKMFGVSSPAFINQQDAFPLYEDDTDYKQNVINSFQHELPWVREHMEYVINEVSLARNKSTTLDLYSEIILPCCQLLAIKLTDRSIHSLEADTLIKYAHEVFMMNSCDDPKKAHEATIKLSNYFQHRMTMVSSVPGNDFITALAQTGMASSVLISSVIQLLAGLATSLPLLISNVILVLLTDEGIKEKYLLNPSQLVNELLRYAGPAQLIYRIAMDDVLVGTQLIKRGERLALYLSNANTDPSQFACPHQVNSSANSGAHLSLGKGLHACLGAPLIREAVTIIPAKILAHFPDFILDVEKVVWGGSETIKGVVSLPVNSIN